MPVRARSLNDETFKAAVIDLLKCTSDTNVQHHYVGDGFGDVELAGLGIPPIALTLHGAEQLFKRCLHEVKALFESQVYLKNPNVAEAAAACLQAQVLDGIGCITNGQSARCDSTAATMPNTSPDSSLTNDYNSRKNTPNSNTSDDEKKKRASLAIAMAEASLLSQKAALQEQKNF